MNLTRLLSLPVRRRALFLLALGALVYVSVLARRDLWYPDEPDIGEVAQAMYDSGDWVAPRRMGVIWIDYPPMVYWTGVAVSKVAGAMSEAALRLPQALAALALALLTGWMASRWFDPRAGLWAGFALLTFQQFAFEAICYRPDMLFSLFIAAGLWWYSTAFEGRAARWGPRIGAFALLGLAILSKGPLGLLLPGLVLTLWHGGRREWRRILELAPLALVAVAVAAPWYLACAVAMGPQTMLDELWGQNFQRFAGTAVHRGHVQPFHYYLTGIWVDMFPWSLLMPFAGWWIYKSRLWRDRRVQLALWWFGAFFVFLTIATTKRQVYLLPAYPAVALLLGPWLARVGDPEAIGRPADPRPVRVWGALLALMIGALGVAAAIGAAGTGRLIARFELDELQTMTAWALRGPLTVLALAALSGGLWIALAWWWGGSREILRRVGATLVVVYFLLGMIVLPAFDPVKSYRAAGTWLADRLEPDQPFGLLNPLPHGTAEKSYGFRKMGAFGYYSAHHVEVFFTRADMASFFRQHPTSVVLVAVEVASEYLGEDESAWRHRVVRQLQTGSHRYYVVEAPPGVLGQARRSS